MSRSKEMPFCAMLQYHKWTWIYHHNDMMDWTFLISRSFCPQRIRSSGQGFRLVQIRNNITKRTLISAAICHFSGVISYFTQTRNGVTEMTLLVSAELYMILRSVSKVVLLPC